MATTHVQGVAGRLLETLTCRDNAGNLISAFASVSRIPVVDFRFNSEGMQGVYVRGVNMTTPSMMKMGVEDTVLWIAGGFVLGAAALIIEANDHGGSGNSNNNCPAFTLNVCSSLNTGGLYGASCCPG